MVGSRGGGNQPWISISKASSCPPMHQGEMSVMMMMSVMMTPMMTVILMMMMREMRLD